MYIPVSGLKKGIRKKEKARLRLVAIYRNELHDLLKTGDWSGQVKIRIDSSLH